ncbi:MAG: rod shape-determining protein MreC [Firmicutes bacterium]|nr:rod shape-determining protein MreC [Bacillota bacterium]
MYQKKQMKKKIKIIVVSLLSVLLILISIVFIKDERNLTFFEKITKDGSLFVSNIVLSPINYIKDKIKESNDKKDLYEKYKELETKVESYESLFALKEEKEKELAELKKVLELNALLSDKKVMNAVVVNRNLDYWHDTITINKGSHDGIIEGMPVVVSEGLIGRISSVSNFNSTVKLLTSPTNYKISVKIDNGDDYIFGLLSRYDEEANQYLIEGISQTIKITDGALVTTTGMGNIFPSGIVIGKVIGSKPDSYDLTRIIEVKPSVDFDDFSVVTILKRNVDL